LEDIENNSYNYNFIHFNPELILLKGTRWSCCKMWN